MGTSLCNLNVYNPDKKEYDPGKEYFVAHIVEDWDTILENEHEHDFDRICNLAVSLSKSLDTNIVTTIYFDDDIFELSIYSSGKKKAYYYNEYGRIESKNYSAMVSMLDLDFIAAKAFRYLLKKEMFAGDAISKLSAISGLPFYIEKFMYDHMPDRLIPDKEAVLKEIEAENAKTKKKSKASDTVELLCEIPGMVVDKTIDYEDGKHGVVRVVEPSDGEIDYSHIHCYQITGDKNPSLQKIYDYKLPFEKWAPGEQSRALVQFPDMLAVYNDWGCIVHQFCEEDEIAEVESIGAIPIDRYNPIKYEGLAKKGINPMELPFNPGKLELLEGVDPGSSFFDTCNTFVKIDNGYMIHMGAYVDYANRKQYIVVDFFRDTRDYLKTYIIPIEYDFKFYSITSDYCYIEEKQEIIIGEHIINIKDKTFTVSDTLPAKAQHIICRKLHNGKEVLLIQSSKNIMVFDMDYQLLLSKSVKGNIITKMIDDEDNLYVITSSNILGLGYSHDFKPKDVVRLYKIPLVKDNTTVFFK